jgi:transposase
MPSQSPFRIEPTKDEHAILQKRAAAHTAPYWEVVRARIVLLAAEGTSNKEIAARLDTTPQTACKWRKRFYEEGLGMDWRTGPAPADRPSFPPEARMEVKALACELPATSGVPLSRWSAGEVAREAIDRGLVAKISATTVWRWLCEGMPSALFTTARGSSLAIRTSPRKPLWCWTSTRVGGRARLSERGST